MKPGMIFKEAWPGAIYFSGVKKMARWAAGNSIPHLKNKFHIYIN